MSGQGLSSSGLRSVKKKPGRGVHLTSQSKHILTSVRSYFEQEKRTGKSFIKNRPLDRTATATGISKTTIKRIYQTMTEDKEILTPTKRYIKSRITINPDSLDKEVIRWTVHCLPLHIRISSSLSTLKNTFNQFYLNSTISSLVTVHFKLSPCHHLSLIHVSYI